VFSHEKLNQFMALGRPAWREARATIQDLLSVDGKNDLLRANPSLQAKVLIPLNDIQSHLPAQIGDYTDFYASKEHATNVGTMFRGKDNALMPNWVHIPVGYHGRASSVVISGTPIKRPSAVVNDPATQAPVFAVSTKLDIELEVAFLVGVGNELGDRIPIESAEEHIFGMVIMNDWSGILLLIKQEIYRSLNTFLWVRFWERISELQFPLGLSLWMLLKITEYRYLFKNPLLLNICSINLLIKMHMMLSSKFY
jgi:fumarylacetoacetase